MGCCCSSKNNAIASTTEKEIAVELHKTLELDDAVGSISSQESEYKLNIHHRAAVVSDGYTKVEKSITGHFFISLEKNGERQYFGKYPRGGGPIKSIFGREKIESEKEAESVLCLQQFEIKNNQKYLHTKTINLSAEQYNKAFEYAKSKSEGKMAKMYVLGLADCADFVQSVYNAAGLPLYFSSAFRRKELILSLAGGKVLTTYGCLDKFVAKFEKIYSSNRQKLAAKLNMNEDHIIPLSGGTFFVDIDDALQKIMIQQEIYASEINKLYIYNLRVDNMFNLIKVKLREQYDNKLSKVKELLKNKIAKYKWNADMKFKAKVKERKKLLKTQLDKDLILANVKLVEYEAEVEEAKLQGNYDLLIKRKKKMKRLKAIIKKKNDQYHVLEEYFEGKLKSQVEEKMLENTKKEFEIIYDRMNRYKIPIVKHIKGLIDVGDDDKISLSSYRLKLEQIARVLLENTSHKLEKMITNDFEIFLNIILLRITTSIGKKPQRNSLISFLTNISIKILVKKLKNIKRIS